MFFSVSPGGSSRKLKTNPFKQLFYDFKYTSWLAIEECACEPLYIQISFLFLILCSILVNISKKYSKSPAECRYGATDISILLIKLATKLLQIRQSSYINNIIY